MNCPFESFLILLINLSRSVLSFLIRFESNKELAEIKIIRVVRITNMWSLKISVNAELFWNNIMYHSVLGNFFQLHKKVPLSVLNLN